MSIRAVSLCTTMWALLQEHSSNKKRRVCLERVVVLLGS